MNQKPLLKRILKWVIGVPIALLFVIILIGIFAPESAKNKKVTAVEARSPEAAVQQEETVTQTESEGVAENDPYYMMHVVFEGQPEIEEIRPMFEAVMKRYKMDATDDNRQKVASVLITLRKESKVGVTEMELLKNIYEEGAPQLKFAEQAGISAVLLEKSKS